MIPQGYQSGDKVPRKPLQPRARRQWRGILRRAGTARSSRHLATPALVNPADCSARYCRVSLCSPFPAVQGVPIFHGASVFIDGQRDGVKHFLQENQLVFSTGHIAAWLGRRCLCAVFHMGICWSPPYIKAGKRLPPSPPCLLCNFRLALHRTGKQGVGIVIAVEGP